MSLNEPNKNIVLVILAAGKSSRMNSIKQLLPWKEGTLLSNAIETGNISDASSVLVILGANSDKIKPTIEQLNIAVVENSNWNRGLGTSIASAIKYVRDQNIRAEGVLILLADMPFVSIDHLNTLIENFELDKRVIVSTKKGGKSMVPAIFDKYYFDELSQLTGDFGAKDLMNKYKGHLKFVEVTSSHIIKDLDTPEDYNQNKPR